MHMFVCVCIVCICMYVQIRQCQYIQIYAHPQIVPIGLDEECPSIDETQRYGAWWLLARPHAAAQPGGHVSFCLVCFLARPMACSGQNIVGIGIGGRFFSSVTCWLGT
jgi:hypothetical protein